MIKINWYLVIVLLLLADNAYAKRVTQQEWQCSVDLGQGRTGDLFLIRAEGEVKGGVRVASDTEPLNHRIVGVWENKNLFITRLSDNSREYAMAAIMLFNGRKKILMGGRYGTVYQHTWSGDCEFVSEKEIEVSDDDTVGTTTDEPQQLVRPSLRAKVTPNRPTTKDRVEVSATASHPRGIKSVSIFINDELVKTCRSQSCKKSWPSLREGTYSWHVEAVSNTGTKNGQRPRDLVVRKAPAVGRCSIKGKAKGRSADSANLYAVNVYGPNNSNNFKESKRFSNGRYQINNLSEGVYQLFVDTRMDLPIRVSPNPTRVRCGKSGVVTRNFEFR